MTISTSVVNVDDSMEDARAEIVDVVVGAPGGRNQLFSINKPLLTDHSGYLRRLLGVPSESIPLCRVDPTIFKYFVRFCEIKVNQRPSDYVMTEDHAYSEYSLCVQAYTAAVFLQSSSYQRYLKNALFLGLDNKELPAGKICELLIASYALDVRDKVRLRIHDYAFKRLDCLRAEASWHNIIKQHPRVVIELLYSMSLKKFTIKDPTLREKKDKDNRVNLSAPEICQRLCDVAKSDTPENVRQRTHYYAYRRLPHLRVECLWKELVKERPEAVIAILYSISPSTARFNADPVTSIKPI